MAQSGEKRPLRICSACGGHDDHPRHVIATAVGDPAAQVEARVLQSAARSLPENEAGQQALAELMDDSTVSRHLDCCAEAGCPDDSCVELRQGAEDKRGNDLLKHLQGE